MKTFTFAEKNGNAVIILSADSYKEAIKYLKTIVSDIDAWRTQD